MLVTERLSGLRRWICRRVVAFLVALVVALFLVGTKSDTLVRYVGRNRIDDAWEWVHRPLDPLPPTPASAAGLADGRAEHWQREPHHNARTAVGRTRPQRHDSVAIATDAAAKSSDRVRVFTSTEEKKRIRLVESLDEALARVTLPPLTAAAAHRFSEEATYGLKLLDFECPSHDEMVHVKGCQLSCTTAAAAAMQQYPSSKTFRTSSSSILPCARATSICITMSTTTTAAQNRCRYIDVNAEKTWATLKSLQLATRPFSGSLQSFVKDGNSDAAVELVRTWGWRDSSVTPSAVQTHDGAPCFDADAKVGMRCSGKGENLLGRCFCVAGWRGIHCEEEDMLNKPICTNKDDRCFWTHDAGVFIVSRDRWMAAQEAELGVWSSGGERSNDPDTGDRVADHMKDFNEYKDVGDIGSDLGVFLEVGSGERERASATRALPNRERFSSFFPPIPILTLDSHFRFSLQILTSDSHFRFSLQILTDSHYRAMDAVVTDVEKATFYCEEVCCSRARSFGLQLQCRNVRV